MAAFPYVQAQEKITLRYLGTAVNQDKAIAEKFEKDTRTISTMSIRCLSVDPEQLAVAVLVAQIEHRRGPGQAVLWIEDQTAAIGQAGCQRFALGQ